MALVRLGRLDDLVSLSQLAQWLGQHSPMVGNPPGNGPARAAPEGCPRGVKKKP